jgi:hypothetical protein
MAGKKSSGKHYTSKGERKSSISTASTDAGDRLLNQLKALKKGRNVNITLPQSYQTTDKEGKLVTKTRMVTTKVDGKEWLKKRQGTAEKVAAE